MTITKLNQWAFSKDLRRLINGIKDRQGNDKRILITIRIQELNGTRYNTTTKWVYNNQTKELISFK